MSLRTPDRAKLSDLIKSDKRAELLTAQQLDGILRYYELLYLGNQKQNLTRLDSPFDFYRGHAIDSLELIASKFVSGRALDFGSGCGVPGILAAICAPEIKWTLAESENAKGSFLKEAVQELGLNSRVHVYCGRGEDFLKAERVDCIVSRAVGSVDKLFHLIKKCSTWNTMVLLKGPKWEDEKNSPLFRRSAGGLQLDGEYKYQTQPDSPFRVIAKISRVPRGTGTKKAQK